MHAPRQGIDKLNGKYFQKSTFFLYPLLGIPKTVIPLETYLVWNNYGVEKDVLICKYSKFAKPTELQIEAANILSHPLFLSHHTLDDKSNIYIFDLSKQGNILGLFKKGKYSKFPLAAKEKIVKFYKPGSYTASYIKSYLYPNDYYYLYSSLLDVPVKLLQEIGELTDPPNMEKETLTVSVKVTK